MNNIELEKFLQLAQKCNNLERENIDLRAEIRDLKEDIAKIKLKELLNNPTETPFVVPLEEGEAE